MCAEPDLYFRQAELKDIADIRAMVDTEVRKDVFDNTERVKKFITKDICVLCFLDNRLIGWAVKQRNSDTLIRFLIIKELRGKGYGKKLLDVINPQIVRSKTDQSTGDPSPFYEKHGYKPVGELSGRKKNVQFMWKNNQ